jgi:hypothetical protein
MIKRINSGKINSIKDLNGIDVGNIDLTVSNQNNSFLIIRTPLGGGLLISSYGDCGRIVWEIWKPHIKELDMSSQSIREYMYEMGLVHEDELEDFIRLFGPIRTTIIIT